MRALMDLFPDIQLDRGKFQFLPGMSIHPYPFPLLLFLLFITASSTYFVAIENFWKSAENRRRFFTRFAREKKFDPLKPGNWYSIRPSSIKAATVSDSLFLFLFLFFV